MSDTELLPKTKAEPVRRLEVFTGTGRRRPWTAEEKERIVAESYEAGGTVSAIARRHGLTAPQLFALLGKDAGGLSPTTVGRLKEAWSEEHVRWSKRDLSAKRTSISGPTASMCMLGSRTLRSAC